MPIFTLAVAIARLLVNDHNITFEQRLLVPVFGCETSGSWDKNRSGQFLQTGLGARRSRSRSDRT